MRTGVPHILHPPKCAEPTFVPQHVSRSIGSLGDPTVQIDEVFALNGMRRDLTVSMQIHIDGKIATAQVTS